MVASTVTVWSPGPPATYSSSIVRPAIDVVWTGGVGPFDVEYTWDTDPTFANGGGLRQIVTNVSVTSLDRAAPSADLGDVSDGTTWYVRANVIDQGDSGAALADSNNSFTYADPTLELRHRYIHTNVGVAYDNKDRPKERQVISIDATGGTFTMSFSGQGPSAAVGFDDSAASIETALEGLSNITDVYVKKLDVQRWEVEFLDVSPSPIPAITLGTGSLTGGGATGTVVIAVDDQDAYGTSIGGTAAADGSQNPSLFNHFRYMFAHIGVGFHAYDEPAGGWGVSIGGTEGPDGNWKTTNRHLYLLGSVGVGYDPIDRPALGWNGNTGLTSQGPPDGYAIDFPRHLYQLANVDATQPCPFVFGLSQTVIDPGSTLVVTGQGLVSDTNPTADAWGAEVRLYDSPSLAASYVSLAITDWQAGSLEDSITVTIPGGASSGYVAVVHTTGTPSCSGSNFKALTVTALQPDRDSGWWVEVWSLRNDSPIVRPLPNVYSAEFEMIADDIGRGAVFLPANHPDLAEIVDRTASPPVQRLVKVYTHGRYAYGFVPEDREDSHDDDAAHSVRVFGEGQEGILRWGRCLWKDYPAQPAQARTWLYGSGDNAYPGGNMEPNNQITNGDLEDAVLPPWYAVGTATLFDGTTEPRTGSYSLEVTPSASGDGAAIEFQVEDGWREYVDVYLKDPIASGDDFTVDVLDSGAGVVATSTIAPASATWTKVTLTYVPAESATHTLRIRYTDGAGTPHLFYLDDVASYGKPNLGSGFNLSRATASATRDQVAGGLHALSLACNSGGDVTFNGYVDTFAVEPNRDYSATFNVQGQAGKSVSVGLRLGGILDQQTVVLTGVGTWDQVTLSGTAGANESTGRYAISSINSTAEIIYVDEVQVTPGQAAANAGQIVSDVLTAMQARGTLSFVTTDFSGSLTSAGNVWPETISLEVQPEWTMWDLLEKLIGFGYSMRFAPTNWTAGGDTGWRLQLFAPLEVGSNWSTTPDGPAILPSQTLEDAGASQAPPATTVVFAEGVDGIWSTAASDAATIAALERREDFVSSRSSQDGATVGKVAQQRLAVTAVRGERFTVRMVEESDPLPFFDFLPHDRMRAHVPQQDGMPDLVADAVYRVAAVTANLSGSGRTQRWEVDMGRYQLHANRIRDAILARLIRRQATEQYEPGVGSIST